MKWFRHDSNAHSDAKLKRLRIKYGMEGYGLYWYCLELIADRVERNRLTFELEHDAEILSHDIGIHYERVQEMMLYMIKLELFECSGTTITCLKLASRLDDTTSRHPEIKQLQRNLQKLFPPSPEVSGGSSEVSEETSDRLDQIRSDILLLRNKITGDFNFQSFEAYLEHRKAIKAKKLKPASIEKQALWLISQGDHETQRKIIETTIRNGWTGLFPLKNGDGNADQQQTNRSKPSLAERATAARKETERRLESEDDV